MLTGISLALKPSSGVAAVIPVAPPYEEPEEEPGTPPAGDPTPPDPEGEDPPPIDPDTEEPEPGIDPDWVEADRIEVSDGKQTVTRTEVDPGTWGNAYVAAPLVGYDYWEFHIHASTPNNATLAVGVTNALLPLNGIPGDLPGTLAWWSNGTIRNNGASTAGFPTYGRRDKLSIARDRDTGRVWFARNGTWLGSTPAIGGAGHQGTLIGSGPYYPFIGLYSTGTRGTFTFVDSKFSYPIPAGFYPIGKSPGPVPLLVTLGHIFVQE